MIKGSTWSLQQMHRGPTNISHFQVSAESWHQSQPRADLPLWHRNTPSIGSMTWWEVLCMGSEQSNRTYSTNMPDSVLGHSVYNSGRESLTWQLGNLVPRRCQNMLVASQPAKISTRISTDYLRTLHTWILQPHGQVVTRRTDKSVAWSLRQSLESCLQLHWNHLSTWRHFCLETKRREELPTIMPVIFIQ